MEKSQVSNQGCEQQFQAILDAIDNHKGKGNNATECEKANDRLDKALDDFAPEFTVSQINGILNKVQEAEIMLNSWFASKIWGKCPDRILDEKVAKKLLEHCENLNVDDFDDFLDKVETEDCEEIKKFHCEQQFQAILDAIKAGCKLAEALNSFDFEFTVSQIKGILNNAEAARMILGGWFVSKICGKCKNEILDKETAKNLLQHCKDLNGSNFNNFLDKVETEDCEEIKKFHCEQQFQAILDAIDNYKGKKDDTEEWNNLSYQLNEMLDNFNFEFTLEQINEILKHAKGANLILNYWFAAKIWGKCPDGILDEQTLRNLLSWFQILNNNFNKFANKVKKENREKIKEIREERFQAILNAINNYKGEEYEAVEEGKKYDTEELGPADDQLAEALNKFNFEFTLDQINKILDAAKDANLLLNSVCAYKILDKCPDGILDKEAAAIFEDFGNKSDYPEIVDDELFFSKCNSEVKIAKKHQKIKEATQQNKSRGILGGIGVTFGVLFGLGAIGLGTAVGIGALAVTIAAPIAAAIAVVGLALISFSSYFVDKFRVNKVLNEISNEILNEKAVAENAIPFDLRKRKEIQSAKALLDLRKCLLDLRKGKEYSK